MITEKKKNLLSEEKSELKIKRKKLFFKLIAIFIALVVIFVGATGIVTYIGNKANMKKVLSYENVGARQIQTEVYEDGGLNIYCDDELKVMQLTDVHIGGGWLSLHKDSMAISTVASMITAEKPDLVIVTGDLAYPIIFQAGTTNNFNAIKIFASLMESLGVYWTMTFGNHDVESHSVYSHEDVLELLSSDEYPHCLLSDVKGDVDGYSNQVINIVNSDNIITRSLILLDSHAYVQGHLPVINQAYDNIHDNQIEWYKQKISELNSKNEATFASLSPNKATAYARNFVVVPTSAFFHIPLTEYRDAWDEYVENGYNDTENVKFVYGVQGEKVCCGNSEDMLFETMLELGSTDSVFCGHDHINIYSVDYKGIRLTYGMSVDYLAYLGISKELTQRGCTIITYYPDGTFDNVAENYYQEKYVAEYEKETVEMQ